MASKRLLLLSNSKNSGQGYLEHALSVISEFLGRGVGRVLFIPFAGVIRSFDEYEALVKGRFQEIGYDLTSIHRAADAKEAVQNAEAVAVGGGNTFHLLRRLYDNGLLEPIRKRVASGAPYIGWSAGSNVACPTVMTTNDMPIVEPPSFAALGLVPFQINPHYLDAHPDAGVAGFRLHNPDGTLQAYFRDARGTRRIGRSTSSDQGRTWSEVTATDLPNPSGGIEAILLRSGAIAVVHNDQTGQERDRLSIALSRDGGLTWPTRKVIVHVPGGRFDYPSIIQARDGRIHVTFSDNLKTVRHASFSEGWISAP